MSDGEHQRERPDETGDTPSWLHDAAGRCALLLPFLITAGIVWVSWALYGTSDFRTVPGKALGQLIATAASTGPNELPAAVREYTARLAWSAVAGVYLVLLIAAAIIGVWIIYRLFTATPRCGLTNRWPWSALLAILFVMMSWYVLRHITYGVISGALLDPTVFAQAPDLPGRQQFFSSGGQITALFLAALSTLLLPSAECGDERCLRDRTDLLKLILAVGTALLVVDVVREDALFRWAVAFIDPSNTTTATTIQSLTSTIVAVRGVQGTVFLAAIYLPAALILRARAWRTVPASAATIPEATQWLRDRGLLDSSAAAQLRPVVAVLLPLITGMLSGPAADVLRNLAGR